MIQEIEQTTEVAGETADASPTVADGNVRIRLRV